VLILATHPSDCVMCVKGVLDANIIFSVNYMNLNDEVSSPTSMSKFICKIYR